MHGGNRQRLVIVISAGYGSTGLPKPLADMRGKPMVQHVYERALQVHGADAVVVATDDVRVGAIVHAFGGVCVMTSPEHPSATDRLAEVMTQVDADLYIDLQQDQPLVRPADLAALAAGMWAHPSVQVGTLCHRIPPEDAANPNTVKVVLASNGDALYFSRAPIPFARESCDVARYLKHVGVYAYRRDVLAAYTSLPQTMLEQAEKLEQLRLLSAGLRIRGFEVAAPRLGVDTPELLDQDRALKAGQEPVTQPTLAGVRLVITDVDGVLTDGGIYYDQTGECLKRFHVRDGLGIRLLEECGIHVAVLSGRDSATLRKRVTDLGVTLLQFGVKDKAAACRQLMEEAAVTASQTACIGDDSIDLPAFAVCGLAFAVADAPPYVKKRASKVLLTKGGEGALRELADAILVAQGREDVFDTAEGFASVMARMAQ
jgi:3-deoxy-D-manno-octulosonate 8-phosphate phosphatase (KDO 8-P phosphatase)